MRSGQPTNRIKIDRCQRWVREAVHVGPDGRHWLTDVQLIERCGVTRSFLRWAEKPSRLRPGQKALRSKVIPNPVKQKGSPGTIRVYLEDDVRPILAGEDGCRSMAAPWAAVTTVPDAGAVTADTTQEWA